MNYAKIKRYDIANGEGLRVSLFLSGCRFHCPGCFNPEAQDFDYGQRYTDKTEAELIRLVSDEHIDGLSLLGGDPLWQDAEGMRGLIRLCEKVRAMDKSIWLWSGFTWEEIFSNEPDDENSDRALRRRLIGCCDVFVDGRFVESRRDLRLKWRGSANQRTINVKMSASGGKIDDKSIVLYGENEM